MADVFGHLGLRITDDSQEVTSMPLYFKVADTEELGTLLSALDAVAALVQAVCDGQVLKGFCALTVPLTTTTSPVAGSRIESTGLIRTLTIDGFTRNYGVDIPALKSSTLLAGTKKIDMTNAAIAALTARLLDTELATVFTNPTGNPFDEIPSGRQTFRKHRRQANRA